MSYPNVPQTSLPRVRRTFADWGVAYKVALGVVTVGVFVVVWSPFVGSLLYDQGVTPLIELLGAPEGRQALPAHEPETGTELLAVLGGYNVVVGICMFCARLVLELLGLAGEPILTGRMRPPGKLALGTAAAGVVVFAAGAFPGLLISLFFIDHESAVLGITATLDAISQAGSLLLVCSLITLVLRGRGIRGALLGWADVVGWAKLRCGWINRLSMALVVAGMIGAVPFLPFDSVATIFASTGVTVLALGIVPQFRAGGRP